MSLQGILRVISDDPQLRRALEEADAPGSPGADLIAPPALRPFLAASLAGRRFVLAVTAFGLVGVAEYFAMPWRRGVGHDA